jgi:hypothetical protein
MKKSLLVFSIIGIILGILYLIPSFNRETYSELVILTFFILLFSILIGYMFADKEKYLLKISAASLFYLSAVLLIALQFQLLGFGGGGSYGGADWESLFIGIFALLSSILLFIILFFKRENFMLNIFLAIVALIFGNMFSLAGLGYFLIIGIALSILILIISIIVLIVLRIKK